MSASVSVIDLYSAESWSISTALCVLSGNNETEVEWITVRCLRFTLLLLDITYNKGVSQDIIEQKLRYKLKQYNWSKSEIAWTIFYVFLPVSMCYLYGMSSG